MSNWLASVVLFYSSRFEQHFPCSSFHFSLLVFVSSNWCTILSSSTHQLAFVLFVLRNRCWCWFIQHISLSSSHFFLKFLFFWKVIVLVLRENFMDDCPNIRLDQYASYILRMVKASVNLSILFLSTKDRFMSSAHIMHVIIQRELSGFHFYHHWWFLKQVQSVLVVKESVLFLGGF